jgi:hypothetical protein
VLWKRNVSIAAKSFAAAPIKSSALISAGIITITDLTGIPIILFVMFTDYYERTEEYSLTCTMREK